MYTPMECALALVMVKCEVDVCGLGAFRAQDTARDVIKALEVEGFTIISRRGCGHDWQVVTSDLVVCRICGERR